MDPETHTLRSTREVLDKRLQCIDFVIKEFEYRDIDNEFIKYVVHELKQFQKSLIGKNSRKKVEKMLASSSEAIEIYDMIRKRENTLETTKKILENKE